MCLPGTANSKPAALDFMVAAYACNSECSIDDGHACRLRVFLQPAENAICAHVGPYGQYAYWWPQPKPQALKPPEGSALHPHVFDTWSRGVSSGNCTCKI